MQSAVGKKIGVLGLQGSIREHVAALRACGATVVEVLTAADLERVCGLIIPGGESTTISKLMRRAGLFDEVRARALNGMPVWGTCAGMILLAQGGESEMEPLALMDLEVERNAYGRQVDSFQESVLLELTEEVLFPAVFIRAPKVSRVGEGVKVLAKCGDSPIMCRQGNLLATSFHPELTDDRRVHEYFIQMCNG
ncbi:pyridoxal 5'-phosphate synthase glutaminase subunit PdxT [Patescibacteria group bacterium]|nr:pyridoxal 5'-phosphate synthase glutaminase subunit PdxT [Patescibacteria group bacterium]